MRANIFEGIKCRILAHSNGRRQLPAIGKEGYDRYDCCIKLSKKGEWGSLACNPIYSVIFVAVEGNTSYDALSFLVPPHASFLDRRKILSPNEGLVCNPRACFLCRYGHSKEKEYTIEGCCEVCVRDHCREGTRLARELFMLQWKFGKDVAGLIICIRIQL